MRCLTSLFWVALATRTWREVCLDFEPFFCWVQLTVRDAIACRGCFRGYRRAGALCGIDVLDEPGPVVKRDGSCTAKCCAALTGLVLRFKVKNTHLLVLGGLLLGRRFFLEPRSSLIVGVAGSVASLAEVELDEGASQGVSR